MDLRIFGRVRQVLQGVDQLDAGTEEQLRMSEQGALLVAPAASAYGETVRLGRAYEVHTTTAIAAVVARPTTAHMLSLYNGEPDDGRIYVIDRAWAINEVSTAVAS